MAFQLTGVGNATASGNSAACRITVPDGVYWKIISLDLLAASSAAAGLRFFYVAFQNAGADVLYRLIPTTLIPALSDLVLCAAEGAAPSVVTSPVSSVVFESRPYASVFLIPGSYLQMHEGNGVDAANDTADLGISYEEYRDLPDVAPVIVAPSLSPGHPFA